MMKSRKADIIRKIGNLAPPNISIPSWMGNQSPDSVFSSFKSSIEWAVKKHVEEALVLILEDLYTTEEFEDDLGLNKPK